MDLLLLARLRGDASRHEAAIAALTAGLATAGDDVRESEFVAVYVLHLAVELLEVGNRDVAGKLHAVSGAAGRSSPT